MPWATGGLTIKKQATVRINDQITESQVRVIDSQGNQLGIIALDEAIRRAEDGGLDLVEISPNAEPPVCRVMDYGKFIFEQNKKRAAAKKKQKQIQVKEIKLRPGTEEADYQVKLRKIVEFLEHGNKVKITLRFRGREMRHQALGLEVMQRIEADTQARADVEHRPKLEGRQIVMVLGPRRK